MTTFDPTLASRLVQEAREDDERGTPGPWRAANGKGAAQVISEDPQTKCAIYINVDRAHDHHPDTIKRWQRDSLAIARTRNNLRSIAEQLEACMAERDEALRESDRWRHGNTIEGDFVCPNDLVVAQLKSALIGMCCLAEDAAFNREDAPDFQRQIDRVRKLAGDTACPRCTTPGRWLGLTVKVHNGATPNDSVVANRLLDQSPVHPRGCTCLDGGCANQDTTLSNPGDPK